MTPGTYSFIWASCPCTEYSIARTTAKNPRNFALADSIVKRTLEIIYHLNPKGWLLENPQTCLLKHRLVVSGIPFKDVCYCKCSDGKQHMYKKPTRLWGYLPTFVPRPMCTRANPCCFSLDIGRRPDTAQRLGRKEAGRLTRPHTLLQLYSMPRALTDDIAEAAMTHALFESQQGQI